VNRVNPVVVPLDQMAQSLIKNSEMAGVTAYRIGYVFLVPQLIRVLTRAGIGWQQNAVVIAMHSVVHARHVMLVSSAKQDVIAIRTVFAGHAQAARQENGRQEPVRAHKITCAPRAHHVMSVHSRRKSVREPETESALSATPALRANTMK